MATIADPAAALSPAWARIVDDVIVRGEGVYLHADSGKRYLDFTSGIGVVNTGHCHPEVVRAIRDQAEKLLFGQMNCVVPETALSLVEAGIDIIQLDDPALTYYCDPCLMSGQTTHDERLRRDFFVT